ncbi:hypothetical protein [Limosilactobacillus fermentum]
MATTRIDVKPAVLHWVQEASNGTLNEAWTNKIYKWIKNESKPTLNQLKDLSKKAQIPFGYFFLDNWSPVNKIDNLNRDFFVLCHD